MRSEIGNKDEMSHSTSNWNLIWDLINNNKKNKDTNNDQFENV